MRNCGDKNPFFLFWTIRGKNARITQHMRRGQNLECTHTFRKLDGLLGHGIRQAEAGNDTIEIRS